MTTALVIVSIALAISLAANVRQVLWMRSDSSEADALKTQSATYERQRNDAIAGRDVALKRVGELEAMLRETSAQRDAALKERIKKTAEAIRNAETDADALAEFNRMRMQPLDLPKAGDAPASDDRGGTDRVPAP